jgi:hypothetical protein
LNLVMINNKFMQRVKWGLIVMGLSSRSAFVEQRHRVFVLCFEVERRNRRRHAFSSMRRRSIEHI